MGCRPKEFPPWAALSLCLLFVGLPLVGCSTNVPVPPAVTTFPSGAVEAPNNRINQLVMGQATLEGSAQGTPLGSGDLVDIRVADLPELKDVHARVTPAGTILLPLLGQMKADGMTAEELHEKLRTVLGEKYLKNPQVSVSVAEMRSHKVAVMGEVNKPGLFDLTSRLRLADAIGMAGGLKEDASPRVYLIRRASVGVPPAVAEEASSPPKTRKRAAAAPRSANIIEIDLRDILDGKSERGNIPLLSGDVIQVPQAGSVYVGGRVKTPKMVPILGGAITAQQAIVAAGGATELADLHEIWVYRRLPGGQRQTIALDLGRDNRSRVDFTLQKDDVLLVGTANGMLAWTTFRDSVLGRVGMFVTP